MRKAPKRGYEQPSLFLDRIHRIFWIFFVFLPSLMEGRKFNPAGGGTSPPEAGKGGLTPHYRVLISLIPFSKFPPSKRDYTFLPFIWKGKNKSCISC